MYEIVLNLVKYDFIHFIFGKNLKNVRTMCKCSAEEDRIWQDTQQRKCSASII